MKYKYNIALDAMGGDNAPKKVVEGLKIFLWEDNEIAFTLFGIRRKIEEHLQKFNILENQRIFIEDCEKIITNEMSVRDSIKIGKDTSMWRSIDSVKNKKCDIIISSGNTGALLVISKLLLKTIDGVDKPPLAGLWPNKKNLSIVLDLGANVECNEKNFVQFSKIGSELYSVLFDKQRPNVGLLNIGSEEIKGNETLKNSNSLLNQLDNNFVYKGYIEGNDITKGEVDVIVTDGFTGNVALKTAEGTANYITSEIKESFSDNFLSKLSYLVTYPVFSKIKKKLDPRNYNGAIFLGLTSPVIKSHGGADGYAFYNSIKLSSKILHGNLINKIKNNFVNGKK